MEEHLRTIFNFMKAAQTITAIYGSPNGPTDPVKYYEIMVKLMEDPDLLAAQFALLLGNEFVIIRAQPGNPSAVTL